MNLTGTELTELPLPAAVVDPQDTLIARTPEWEGATPGAVSYPVRRNRLVVCTGNVDPRCTDLLEQLLDALDDVGTGLGRREAIQVGMLASSLRLLAGRRVASTGGSSDVLELARIGIAARTSLRVEVEAGPERVVAAPDVAALVLVQLAANAERHAGASTVTIAQRATAFEVRWRVPGTRTAVVQVNRRRAARRRWGLGFACIAADTLGGAVYPPHVDDEGVTVASLELGLARLALPLAAVRHGRVLKATRTWDEETGCVPGTAVNSDARLGAAVAAAGATHGRLRVVDGWWTRSVRGGTVVWIAIPPDDILDRARDVLAGVVHERALWDGIPEPGQSRVFALATLLDHALGTPLPRVPGFSWARRYAELSGAFGAHLPIPELRGTGAIDPRVVVHVVATGGTGFELDGDDLYLHVRAGSLGEAVSQAFERRADGALKLS